MGFSQLHEQNSDQTVRYSQQQQSRASGRMFIGHLILVVSFTGCSRSTNGTNANLGGLVVNSNGNANAGSRAVSTQPIEFKEPERYSMAMTISAQPVSDAPTSMATQQFGFAKLGSDRRWSFTLGAPLGHIDYLEKSGLKYLMFIDRGQYVEIESNDLGFQPSGVLTPGTAAELLNPRTQYEQLGLEPVNGRTATKYRLTGAADASRKTEGVIFVDQETGMPLRYELTTVAASGTNLRVIFEARDVQLNPDRSQFEVPAGMRKIKTQEAKSQIESFAGPLRSFSDTISGKPTSSSAGAVSIDNKNAGARKKQSANR
jgi:hypothetical protein